MQTYKTLQEILYIFSRLDRLFVLLESGSCSVTRSAAAKQLGEVQRLHPHELNTLLIRTAAYLKSTNWETRVAAAEAVRAIVSNVPQWNPKPTNLKSEEDSQTPPLSCVGRLRFENFEIETVLTNSTHLMASEGKEYDIEEDSTLGIDIKERMAKQRQLLNARLGLDVASKIGIDVSGLFTTEDLTVPPADVHNQTKVEDNRKPLRDLISSVSGAGLSSREKNRAKRKARQAFNKQKSREPTEEEFEPDKKKNKLEDKIKDESALTIDIDAGDAGDWPLEWFCDQLSQDLFSSSWEARHGAATALREILTVHGKGAGKSIYLTIDQMIEYHQAWLEDMAIRLLCVLALDKFGDFVSDSVVAPVRETCAQCLCAVLKLMNEQGCGAALNILLQLLNQEGWEARHGGLLGLKYLLAVREDMVHALLTGAFPNIMKGLSDPVDDVGAVAASALIPIVEKLVKLVPRSIELVVTKLWDLLADQDELASACNSFMGLLAAILSLPEAKALLPPQPLSEVVPKLWPFLSHSTSSVRKATLQTLGTLTDGNTLQWEAQLLQDALRHVYQRVLVEPLCEVRRLAELVWNKLIKHAGLVELLLATCPFISAWLCLSMQPIRIPYDPNLFIFAKSQRKKNIEGINNFDQTVTPAKLYIGGSETTPLVTRETNAIKVRCMAARMLGLLSCYVIKKAPGVDYSKEIEVPLDCYVKILIVHLQSKSALQRMMTGLVISEWSSLDAETLCPQVLKQILHKCLSECVYFDEIAASFTKLAQETKDFIAMMKHYKVPMDVNGDSVLTLDHMKQLTGPDVQQTLVKCKLKQKILDSLEERRRSLHDSVTQTSQDQYMLSVNTLAALSGATVMFKALPEKLTPVVKPLMESIRREADEQLQHLAAKRLADLLDQCRIRDPCPNDKILTNLCTFLRGDPDFTPIINRTHNDNYNGIVTLNNQQRNAEKAAYKRSNSTGRGPGRPPATDIPLEELFRETDDTQKGNRIQRRGATLAFTEIVSYFGSELPTKLSKMWSLMVGQLTTSVDPLNFNAQALLDRDDQAELLLWTLQVLEVCAPYIHEDLKGNLFETCLKRFCVLLSHPYKAVRHLSSRCLAVFAKIDSVPVMELIVSKVLPVLGATTNEIDRQGAVEAIACIVEALQFDIVPYVVLLVVPLLGRMSDQNQCVRLMGTHSFATLVQLMPLDGGVPEPPGLKLSDLCAKREKEREFLSQLLSPSSIPDYQIPVPIDAELRTYQQAGVNWLAFLNKYKLHGILCDDMGLGKTLQSICILAGDHYCREQKYKLTKAPDSAPLPSLVICPPTLTGHWTYEVEKFLSRKYLRPLQYNGSPVEREKLRYRFDKYNLIVASYDIVRKDIHFFSQIKWNYIILDEGHVIKNGKTRTSIAIKQLIANHRLILSGTPIQNNVLELWSLFDFLMPGFLGTEKQFTARYSRPILASRDPKCSSKEQEAGALAMEALHRQVLPFLLRRMKEDVLDDLPPKITQDYYCELSPLQELLYDDFSRSQAHQTLEESLSTGATASSMQGNTHIFQALRYLQNVCNHPKLVLTPSHPQFAQISHQLQNQGSQLDNIHHSAKLPALMQLLQDCGIGVTETQTTELVINQHRALVFCQLKAMLNIIENDLFKKHMPGITYLRLDGSVPASQRQVLVTRFNNDPSIDVLLLTTQVGGLGLNLTGADTVIFVEHDWNPMKDLQAMDRAHRIGQRKVVNVYRLITRSTLEEKIMGLQKFKVQTANTVISGENSRLETMATEQLLDLFSHKPSTSQTNNLSKTTSGGVKAILEALPDLWDQNQYEDEYDLTQFMNKLSN
ncbi:tata-binding protein-associated factor [Holotrichia oblita]|uniref:Tata-binding protein-associated factor n=1 Tax=Holotrichia oblita TaxID=644536 RepID=A0ACB9SNC1_HOLOL|nr:tata-binding protein-associated factor [Holotrichia oblita]